MFENSKKNKLYCSKKSFRSRGLFSSLLQTRVEQKKVGEEREGERKNGTSFLNKRKNERGRGMNLMILQKKRPIQKPSPRKKKCFAFIL